MRWTQARLKEAALLWNDPDDIPMETMTSKLGVTKNALLGAVHRNRSMFNTRASNKAKTRTGKVRRMPSGKAIYRDPKEIAKAAILWKDMSLSVAQVIEKSGIAETTFAKMRKYAPKFFPDRAQLRREWKVQNMRKELSDKPKRDNAQSVAHYGQGCFLRSKYGLWLHLSGEYLTNDKNVRWRGLIRQAFVMMDRSEFDLKMMREEGKKENPY